MTPPMSKEGPQAMATEVDVGDEPFLFSAAVTDPVVIEPEVAAQVAGGVEAVLGADFETLFPVAGGAMALPGLKLALGWALEQLPGPVGLGLCAGR